MGNSGRNPHPPATHAPDLRTCFDFLIGRWQCSAHILNREGEWESYSAEWHGQFILDGHAVADEFRMSDAAGKLVVLGMNFRAYDAANRRWNLKWLNALNGAWVELGPDEFGGVHYDGDTIAYAFREPTAGHAFTRATYSNISRAHFTWRGEGSSDGRDWQQFMLVEARRVE